MGADDPQTGLKMGKDNDVAGGANSTTSPGTLPEFPGSDFLAHNAATWMENTIATLGDLKLLAVANGREHPDTVSRSVCIVQRTVIQYESRTVPRPPTAVGTLQRVTTRV